MRIIVVCGAGASSTFVAARLQAAADAAGLDIEATPAALADLPYYAGLADGLLLGSHLAASARMLPEFDGVPTEVLPHDIATDRDGSRALSFARHMLAPTGVGTTGKEAAMATRTVTIAASHGLHARPAKLFAEAAKNSGLDVTVAKGDGKPANAASILGVIALGANQGDEVTLTVEGDGAETVLDQLAGMLETDAE